MSRLQRFFMRVRGTHRLIFFGVLAYDLYIYKTLIDAGLIVLVMLVMAAGLLTGTVAAGLLRNAPETLERTCNAAGLSAMGIFLVSQCFNMRFPVWTYFLGHVLLWFWFSTAFWHASRPLEWEQDFGLETTDD